MSFVACWLIVVCLDAGVGAPWWPWDNGGRHGWPVHVFCLALASFYLGTSHVRRMTANQGPATFVRCPTKSARRWWFPHSCSGAAGCCGTGCGIRVAGKSSLRAFACQRAPPVLSLTCLLQVRRWLWHPHRQQSMCAFASQHAPLVLTLTCLLRMRRWLWHLCRQ